MCLVFRVISTHSASASNTFKMAKFHALFFPFGHHPLNISFETLADLFLNTAQQWLKKVTESDPSQMYAIYMKPNFDFILFYFLELKTKIFKWI